MSDASVTALDYSRTLYLPKTDFPMRGGLPQKEPEILARWARENLYGSLRESGKGRPKFVLHDGPPYANGNVHIGTALNKTLKDIVVRSHQMTGRESNYVPGWDCHGLPIEWKVEEEFYRSKGKVKPDFSDSQAIIAFRKECRAYAEHWLSVQREEFKRLGVVGDWDHPYTTMSYPAEAQIAREIFKFVANGLLYRGSKPVMWSVIEKTALAEAEVEYEELTSDTIIAAFPIASDDASVLIWTTTPWTIPGNRAIAFSRRIAYGRYRVTDSSADNWAKPGATYILAQSLADSVLRAARVDSFEFLGGVDGDALASMVCAHPLHAHGYGFVVPLLDGDHVTEDAGTGFVHTAPGHGREDFELWTASTRLLQERGIDTRIPYTVDENGAFTEEAPGFEGKRVITDKGKPGDANRAVIDALVEAGALVARGRLKARRHPAQKALNDQLFFHPDHTVVRPSHADIGDVSRAFGQDGFIGRGNMRVRAHNGSGAPVEVPAKGNFLRRSLGVKINKDNLRLDLLQQPIGITIGIVSRSHKHASLKIDDRIGNAILLPLVNAPPRQARRKISRPQQPSRRTMRVAVRHLKVFNNLALVPDVIAGSHHIDAQIEKLFRQRGRNPKSRRGIFAVGNDEISRMRTNKFRQTFFHNRPPGTPKNVANKKNSHGREVEIRW